nr:hypothetical protein [Chondromyces crocatus]
MAPSPAIAAGIELALPNGCIVRVQEDFDATTLARLLRVAGGTGAC